MDFPSTSALFGPNADEEFEEDVRKKSDLIEEEFNRRGTYSRDPSSGRSDREE